MKLKAKNFSGTMELPYRITWGKDKGDEVILWISVINPFTGLPMHLDCVVSTFEPTYKENLKIALLRAEEKWGFDLLKIDITEKVQ